MGAQGPQGFGLNRKSGEERRFRDHQASQQPRAGLGARVRHLPNQTIINVKTKPAAMAPRHPFFVSSYTEGDSLRFEVRSGTVNGMTPTLGGTPLYAEDPPSGPLSSGTSHVYLVLTFDYQDQEGYVHTANLEDAKIEVQSFEESEPFGPKGTGDPFYVKLATFVEGKKTAQDIISSLSAHVCDSGQADATGNLGLAQS